MIRRFLLGLLTLGLLAGSGIGAPAGAEETIRLDPRRATALAALPSLEGPSLTAEDLQGRPVVVTFFASWCPPCHAEFDHLKAAKETHGDSIAVVAVNIFELVGGFDDPARLPRFLKRKAPPFRILGEGERVAALFGKVERIPTLFVFDAKGDPVLQFIHARGAQKTHVGAEELQAAIERALAKT